MDDTISGTNSQPMKFLRQNTAEHPLFNTLNGLWESVWERQARNKYKREAEEHHGSHVHAILAVKYNTVMKFTITNKNKVRKT